jgi:hypothetical protein
MFTSFNAPQSVRQLRLHGFGYITLPVVIVRTQLAPSHDYIRTHHLNCIRVRNLLIGYRCPRAFDKQVDVIRPLTFITSELNHFGFDRESLVLGKSRRKSTLSSRKK